MSKVLASLCSESLVPAFEFDIGLIILALDPYIKVYGVGYCKTQNFNWRQRMLHWVWQYPRGSVRFEWNPGLTPWDDVKKPMGQL